MNIAKGIQGIRKFLSTDAKIKGWHISTRTEYIGYNNTQTGLEIIAEYSDNGYTFLGATGNGLCFDK